MRPYVSLFRLHHCVKNAIIFFPIFFAGLFLDFGLLLKCSIVFFAFCLASSSIYVTNDIFDAELDRRHPTKKNRPIAARAAHPRIAAYIALLLAVISLAVSALLNWKVFGVIAAYLILNIFYSIIIKHIAILDVISVALGFVLRIYAGSFAADIPLTHWFVIITFLLALLLALGKRRDEVLLLQNEGVSTRPSVEKYNMAMINSAIIIMASVVVISYIMYTLSPAILSRSYGDKLYLTVIFVLVGLLRYLQILFVEKKNGSPTEIILHDRTMQITVILWLIVFNALIYLKV